MTVLIDYLTVLLEYIDNYITNNCWALEIVEPVPHQYLHTLGMPLIANDSTLLIEHAATMTGEEIDCILDVVLFGGEDVSHQIWTCTFYSHVISRLTFMYGLMVCL